MKPGIYYNPSTLKMAEIIRESNISRDYYLVYLNTYKFGSIKRIDELKNFKYLGKV